MELLTCFDIITLLLLFYNAVCNNSKSNQLLYTSQISGEYHYAVKIIIMDFVNSNAE